MVVVLVTEAVKVVFMVVVWSVVCLRAHTPRQEVHQPGLPAPTCTNTQASVEECLDEVAWSVPWLAATSNTLP